MLKFSSRRKSVNYKTNWSLYKPSLLNLVLAAQKSLPNCTVYDSFIHRYCLFGLFFWTAKNLYFSDIIDNDVIDDYQQQQELNIIDKKILLDIKQMETPSNNNNNNNYFNEIKSLIITDSWNSNVLQHQLELLQQEFPEFELDFQNFDNNNKNNIIKLLLLLIKLENEFSNSIESCKEKDIFREESIIGEFAYNNNNNNNNDNNNKSNNNNNDSVISSAKKRASGLEEYINNKIIIILSKE